MRKLWKKFWDWYSYDMPGSFVGMDRRMIVFAVSTLAFVITMILLILVPKFTDVFSM